MKKIILAAIFGLISFASFAQENVIKVNPLALLGGTDLVSYERALGDQSSAIVGAGYAGYKFGGFKYTNIGGRLEYRYYFDEVLSGWFAGGIAQYQSGKVESETSDIFGTDELDSETNFSSFGVGAKAGYQWVWDSGFSLDLSLGANYSKFSYDDEDGAFATLEGSGIFPQFGFGLGYAF